MRPQTILILEDEHALGTALSFAARRAGHLPTLAASGAAGLDAMKKEKFGALVLDIGLPDMSGLRVLEKVRKHNASLPVLVITAHATLDHAITAQKLGATEYLTKPLDLRQFENTLAALLAQGVPLASPAPPVTDVAKAPTLIGAAPCLQEVFVAIARSCAGNMPALITGPTGSGKTLAASVIHAHGQRAAQPLRSIECSTLKDAEAINIALSDATGTLVLEEITLLPASAQSQLATCLSDSTTPRPRLLATTSADPREAVTQGTLRAELYYGFSALTIPMPPLRERTGDIPALSAFFLAPRDGQASPQITPPALAALQAYAWPGNVRELRHVLDYASTVSRGGPLLLSHLPPHVASAAQDPSQPVMASELEAALSRWLDARLTLQADDSPAYDTLLDQVEAAMLRHLLNRHDNKPTHLASNLRMNRATLRQKLRRAGLQRDDEG